MLKPCRYLTANHHDPDSYEYHCAYYDDYMTDEETIKCHPGGWECYEDPSRGVIFEGRWLTLDEAMDYYKEKARHSLPEGIEHALPDKLDGTAMASLLGWLKKEEQ